MTSALVIAGPSGAARAGAITPRQIRVSQATDLLGTGGDLLAGFEGLGTLTSLFTSDRGKDPLEAGTSGQALRSTGQIVNLISPELGLLTGAGSIFVDRLDRRRQRRLLGLTNAEVRASAARFAGIPRGVLPAVVLRDVQGRIASGLTPVPSRVARSRAFAGARPGPDLFGGNFHVPGLPQRTNLRGLLALTGSGSAGQDARERLVTSFNEAATPTPKAAGIPSLFARRRR